MTPPGRTHAPVAETAALVARLRRAGCVFAEDEAALLLEAADGDAARLEELAARRVRGVPLEHVLGWVDVAGVRLTVADGVFVPRRRTEVLVREAVAHLRAEVAGTRGVVVELCCGCAPVAAVVRARCADRTALEVHAADLDPRAAACARANLGPDAQVHVGDLDDPLPRRLAGRVDVLAANAPYVPSGALGLLPAEAREHEPRAALDGGPDGLALAHRVVQAAPRWLRPGGVVLVETGRDQVEALAAHAGRQGLVPRVVRADDVDGTALAATLPA